MKHNESYDLGFELGMQDAAINAASDILAAWNALKDRPNIDLKMFAKGYIDGSKMTDPQVFIEWNRIDRFLENPMASCECHGMSLEDFERKYMNDVTKFNW